MARQLRVVISSKHPQGKLWILDKQQGWCELDGSISKLGAAFDGGILAMDATMTIGDSLAKELLDSSATAPEPIVLPESECCQGD